MYEKISKLKKFGIFRDFSWGGDTPNFAKFNLIYGWNRSGKTTLSKVFLACEKKTTAFREYPSSGEFEIKVEGKPSINQSNCQNVTYQIRVFNRDFVEDNVFFDPENPATNPIVYVGKKDIKSGKKLRGLQKKSSSLSEKYTNAQNALKDKKKVEDNFRKATAREIKDIVGNLGVSDKYRNYDKGEIEKTIEKTGIDNFSVLSEKEYEEKKNLIGGNQPESLEPLLKYNLNLLYDGKRLQKFSEISEELSTLLKRQVVAEAIGRFKDDEELNIWAEQGFKLHINKEEKKKCLFCQNELSTDFLESLSKHFSKDYEKLQNDTTSLIHELKKLRKDEISEKDLKIPGHLQSRYKDEAKNLNTVLRKLGDWLEKATAKLEEKGKKPLSTIDPPKPPEDFSDLCNKALEGLNSVIADHNSEAENHERNVKDAKEKLENHIIAVATKEQDYSKIKSELLSSTKDEEKAKENFYSNQNKISELEKKTSDIGKAIPEINQHLEEFFGREEILLELDSSKKGYVIKRDGNVAHNLSEGEKNAIAFSYFIVKTREKGFNINEGIVVIDDPVSSFDSNFIHHCYSLVKNNFEDAKQLIVLTHNFEFFNLVKYWFQRKNKKIEIHNKKNEKNIKPIPCEFFMVRNEVENEERCAFIAPLDKTLLEFNSEYHFLFSKLKKFITEEPDDYADSYTIGNIARRFLEIYTNLKIPTTGDLKSKLDQLDSPSIGQIKKDKLYRLIQESSHGLDPTSTIEHKDKSEIKNAIEILMQVVEESDKKHFESLEKSL